MQQDSDDDDDGGAGGGVGRGHGAGVVVGGKVPVVVTSRADSSSSRIASIAASVIAAN